MFEEEILVKFYHSHRGGGGEAGEGGVSGE